MFKIFKLYIKYRLSSLIKDRIINYSSEKNLYIQRQNEWERKIAPNNETSEQFEKIKSEQIKWSVEQWMVNHYKHEEASELLKLIVNELK